MADVMISMADALQNVSTCDGFLINNWHCLSVSKKKMENFENFKHLIIYRSNYDHPFHHFIVLHQIREHIIPFIGVLRFYKKL